MQLHKQYQTMTFNHDFGYKEYITPPHDCDPLRQIIHRKWDDYKHKPKQSKFKVEFKHKGCYFDELVKPYKGNPPPPRYKVEGDMIIRSKSASIKKILVNPKLKKQTYLDEIDRYDKNHKPPGVGKFDLTKYTDIKKKKGSPAKEVREKQRIKNNNFDDTTKVAAELPGPGQFNPHKSVQKLKIDRTTYKDWQQKHKSIEKKLAKSISTKLGPSTYEPIVADTFASRAADKSRPISRWSHGTIEKRQGLRSQYKDPSPCQYQTVNQWVKSSQKEKKIGPVNLFGRVSSARNFSVYH